MVGAYIFTSVDPRDGNVRAPISQHRYLYSRQSPISYNDPTGKSYTLVGLITAIGLSSISSVNAQPRINLWFLSKETISPPTPGSCGYFSWEIRWKLNRPAGSNGGWVVQFVTTSTTYTGGSSKGVITEAWKIQPNKTSTDAKKSDDIFTGVNYPNSEGEYQADGYAIYYDGIELPASFEGDDTYRYTLSHVVIRPKNHGGGKSNTVPHGIHVSWNCVGKNVFTPFYNNAAATEILKYY